MSLNSNEQKKAQLQKELSTIQKEYQLLLTQENEQTFTLKQKNDLEEKNNSINLQIIQLQKDLSDFNNTTSIEELKNKQQQR